MIKVSLPSFLSFKRCDCYISFLVIIVFFPPATIQPVQEESEVDRGNASNCCRSTDALSAPWITNILFTLLSITSSARYLIAWIAWLWPILLIFILPCFFILFIYFTACLVQLYRLRGWLLKQLHLLWTGICSRQARGSFICNVSMPSAHILRKLIACIWDIHGRVFHGYEICGMEKLSLNGPSFIVYYHGTLPLDAYYFISRHAIERNSFPVPVVDRFMFRIPGLQYLLRISRAIVGSVEECVALLVSKPSSCRDSAKSNSLSHEDDQAVEATEGEVLLISPGGVREALFADEYYSVVWGKRRGFARIAKLANRPIYPMFTENVREAIRVVQYGKQWSRRLYELTRLPFALFYGYFPVKLRTYIGDPIYPISSETDEELSDRVREAIEELIRLHQWTPGNLLVAFLQRIPAFDRWVKRHKQNSLENKEGNSVH